jgi:hypothetical protein
VLAVLLLALVTPAAHAASQASIAVHLIGLPPGPTIVIVPVTPQIDTATPLGGMVATYTATMPDGSPSTGTMQFAAPFFDAGGRFALTGTGAAGQIVVNPAGPGLGGLAVPIIERVTLMATSGP